VGAGPAALHCEGCRKDHPAEEVITIYANQHGMTLCLEDEFGRWEIQPAVKDKGVFVKCLDNQGRRIRPTKAIETVQIENIVGLFSNKYGLWMCTTNGLHRLKR